MLDFAAVGLEELKVSPRAKEKRNFVRSPAQNILEVILKSKMFVYRTEKFRSREQVLKEKINSSRVKGVGTP